MSKRVCILLLQVILPHIHTDTHIHSAQTHTHTHAHSPVPLSPLPPPPAFPAPSLSFPTDIIITKHLPASDDRELPWPVCGSNLPTSCAVSVVVPGATVLITTDKAGRVMSRPWVVSQWSVTVRQVTRTLPTVWFQWGGGGGAGAGALLARTVLGVVVFCFVLSILLLCPP